MKLIRLIIKMNEFWLNRKYKAVVLSDDECIRKHCRITRDGRIEV